MSKPATSNSTTRRTSRWRWLLPAVLVLVWLGVGGFGGPFAGKLGDVQQNDNTAFLPSSAEATEAGALYDGFTDTRFVPAIVVAERDSGTTPSDSDFLARVGASVAGQPGFGDQISPPIPSQDGRALQMIVPIDSTVDVGDSVETLRTDLSLSLIHN